MYTETNDTVIVETLLFGLKSLADKDNTNNHHIHKLNSFEINK